MSVGIEPPLQPISDEHFRHKTANSENDARLDIAADNFWGNDRQRAFFDIRHMEKWPIHRRPSCFLFQIEF